MFKRLFFIALVAFTAMPRISMAADAQTQFAVRKFYAVPLVTSQSELVIFDTRPLGQKQQIRITYMTPVKTEQFLATGDGVYKLKVPVTSGHAFIEAEYGFISAYTTVMGATIAAVELNTQSRSFHGSVRLVDGKIYSTGISIVNPASVPTNFTLWVKTEGDRVVAFETFRIPEGGQRMQFLHELIRNMPEGEFSIGVVGGEMMTTGMPGVWDRGLAVAAVSYNRATGLFETVPVKAAGIDK